MFLYLFNRVGSSKRKIMVLDAFKNAFWIFLFRNLKALVVDALVTVLYPTARI